MSDVTRILSQLENGDDSSSDRLLPLVYDELRKLAAARLNQEKPGQTLQATALVHEAYMRLVDVEKAQHWDSRGHFFSAAAEAMRRILVDRARKQMTQKHGGTYRRIELDENLAQNDQTENEKLLNLDIALERLERQDPIKANLVKLRYFAGLTGAQAAESLGIGISTADKYWAHGKVWLRAEMNKIAEESG